jgi:trk system potassium uptake protein
MEILVSQDQSNILWARVHLMSGLIILLACCMLPSLLYGILDQHHHDRSGFLASVGLGLCVGGFIFWRTKFAIKKIEFNHRDAFLIVTLSWLFAGFFGALPYYLYAHLSPSEPCSPLHLATPIVGSEFCSFSNAFFESMSGFTTTGATIINQGLWDTYEQGVGYIGNHQLGLPRGLMLWRCITHFLGGMGIIVLAVAILPLLGIGGMQLFKAEAPGVKTDKLVPRMGQTAMTLWIIYIGFTGILLVIFWISGSMDFFESLCHSMSTMATGGFSTRSSSAAGFQSPFIEWMMIIFMFLAGINFNLHYMVLWGKNRKAYFKNLESKVYILIICISSGIVAIALMMANYEKSVEEALRAAFFQVLAIITTTGYASENFELWTDAPMALMFLLLLMFIGGCAGSTGGGMKVIRHILMVKVWLREFFYLLHPSGKQSIRNDGSVVSYEIIRATVAFIGLYLTLVVLGSIFFVFDGHDLLTSFTCSASSIGNVGPGLGEIGPYDNYASLSSTGKWVSSILMMMGRLEIYTVLMVLNPAAWKH